VPTDRWQLKIRNAFSKGDWEILLHKCRGFSIKYLRASNATDAQLVIQLGAEFIRQQTAAAALAPGEKPSHEIAPNPPEPKAIAKTPAPSSETTPELRVQFQRTRERLEEIRRRLRESHEERARKMENRSKQHSRS
jgi:hypothetical protein